MEREGEGRGVRGRREGEREKMRRGRRRGGGEKMRGILIGGIALLLVLGCNNGAIEELEKRNKFLGSVVNLGNEFLNVFTSFGDMIAESLGFKADAKKADVATYFKKVQGTLENTKTAFNKIVEDMKAQENPNAAGVETAVKTLVENKIEKIIKGANDISGAIGNPSGELLGNIDVAGGTVAGSQGNKISDLINGIKTIVEALGLKEGKSEAGDNNKALASGKRAGTDDAMLLFGNASQGNIASNGAKAAVDASKAVGAVTGADILQAMIKDGINHKIIKGKHFSIYLEELFSFFEFWWHKYSTKNNNDSL